MPSHTFTITLSGLSDSELEQAASDLARAIEGSDQSIRINRRQDSTLAMDFGGTLVLVMGTGAGIAVARGIQNWMGRWRNASITVTDQQGNKQRKLEATGISSSDTVRLFEAFLNVTSEPE